MRRNVFHPPSNHAGTGARPSLDRGPRRSLLREYNWNFGAVSAGQNWDRLAVAVHRCALKLVGEKVARLLLFSGGALFLAGDDISEEFFVITSTVMILGFPFSEKNSGRKPT